MLIIQIIKHISIICNTIIDLYQNLLNLQEKDSSDKILTLNII